MRRALLLLLALVSCSPIPPHPDGLRYRELSFRVPDPAAMRVTLSTGTPAYLLEDASLPIVDLQVFFRAGSFADPRGKEGLAGLMGGMMRVGGTKTLAPEALDEELEFLAAELGISVGDTTGAARLSVLAKDLDRGLAILADVLRNPAFRQEKLDTLKAQALDRMKARNDSADSVEDREANLVFYGDHPLNRLPTKASVESITREDLAAFHARAFHPAGFLVAAAGAFRKEDLVRKLEAAFAEWPAPEDPLVAGAPPVAHEAAPVISCFRKDFPQGRVTIGHMGVDVRHPDVHAIRLMSYVLGAGGFSSRLLRKVRVEEGLAYDVHSDFRPGILYPLPFRIEFQSKSETCAWAAKLCLEEVAKMREKGVTEKELADAIRFFVDGFPALFFATKSQTAATYAQAELLGMPEDYYATFRERISRCTTADILRVAREQLKPEKFAWVVVGDIGAIRKGDARAKLEDLGTVVEVPLADPMTLERPAP